MTGPPGAQLPAGSDDEIMGRTLLKKMTLATPRAMLTDHSLCLGTTLHHRALGRDSDGIIPKDNSVILKYRSGNPSVQ